MKALFLAAILLLPSLTVAQLTPEQNQKFQVAREFYRAQKYAEALRSFMQANKELGGHCVECFINAAYASSNLGQREDVLSFSAKALQSAVTPDEKFTAHLERSRLLRQITPNAKELAESEAEARKAVELQPENALAHAALGVALLRQSKDDAGIVELKWVESHVPDGSMKNSVRMLIADPRRARLEFAPEFTATTSDGMKLTLAEVKGKVVLIDFWATWCPPCRASVPEIKALRKKYGDRLIVLSVSADAKQENWREYISQHEMTWLQSWDKDNHPPVLETFGVRAFPTYILLDGEGIVRERINGLNPQQTLTGRLHDSLEKCLK